MSEKRLLAFVRDLASHGVRHDLNPTMRHGAIFSRYVQRGDIDALHRFYTDYLSGIDCSIRQRAAEALPGRAPVRVVRSARRLR